MLSDLLSKTTIMIQTPVAYGPLHLFFLLGGGGLAVFVAYKLRGIKEQTFKRLIGIIFVYFIISELYKQLFLYYVVNDGSYYWWHFPFQICSLPLYLCPLILLIRNQKAKTYLYTFMMDFNLLGGIMALLEPSGLLYPYLNLTLHSLIWHVLLIFISCLIGFSQRGDVRRFGFYKGLPVLVVGIVIATIINVVCHKWGNISMFYISPYMPSPQIFFSVISLALGIIPGIIIYLFIVCMGGYLCHLIFYLSSIARGKEV